MSWLVVMALLLGLIMAGVGYVIYRNLTEAVNLVFEEVIDGHEVTVGDVSFPRPGLIRVDGLKARDPDGEGHWLEVEEVEISYDLEELKKQRRVRSLRFKRPVIQIDDGVVKGLSGSGLAIGKKKVVSGDKQDIDLSFLTKFADEIRVEDGQVTIEWPGVPRMSFAFDSNLSGMRSSGSGGNVWVSDEPLKLRLREVEVGPEDALVSVDRIDLEALVSRNARTIEIERLEISEPDVQITPQWLASFGTRKVSADAKGKKPVPASSKSNSPAKEADQEGLSVLLKSFVIQQGRFGLNGFDGGDEGRMLPDVAFGASVDWKEIVISRYKIEAADSLTLKLEDLSVDGAMDGGGQTTLLRVDELEANFLPQAVMRDRRLVALTIRRPELRLSSRNLARLVGESSKAGGDSEKANSQESQKPEDSQSEAVAIKAFHLGKISIQEGRLFIEDMVSKLWPDAEAGFSGEFSEVEFGGEGGAVSSSGQQSLHLSGVKVNGGKLGGDERLLSASSVNVGFQIDAVLKEGLVDRVEIRSPEVVVSDDTVSRWMGAAKDKQRKSVEGRDNQEVAGNRGEETEAGKRKIWRIRDLKVSQGSLVTRLEKSVQGVPWLRGNFDVQTLPFEFSADKQQMREPHYRLSFSGLRVRPQAFAAEESDVDDDTLAGERGEISRRDVAYVRALIMDVTPLGLQQDKRIESVVVSGGEMKLNDDFQALIGGKNGAREEDSDARPITPKPDVLDAKSDEASAKADTVSGWRIGELGVNRTIVRLESMIPQLEGVQFSIETSMKDVPLTAAGLARRDYIQQVELAGIELRDPYDGMRTAAMLPTIFLKFSLGGLMKQEVESVDILGPVLYVGEPLFDWIKYQREHRRQNEGTSLGPGEWAGEANDKEGAVTNEGVWKLKKIKAHYGKMVIAPYGIPIGIVPFPFEVETNLEDGQIALNLKIPQEQYVYSLADLKLDLFGLSGEVKFNVPIKQKDNNLVQTFELDRLVWKQFDAENIYVSVTYDANGIYGKLGGKAYDGYVNGEFNIYLKDLGKWDGWLAGTNVNMGPITQAIAPENFVMDGIISGKLVSSGRGLVFGNTTGELEAVTPGQIEITKLDRVLEALPDEWTQLKRSLTELALNGLKQFDYEKAQGRIDMVNRDGEIDLDLRGPTGSRVFHFYLHDWRKKKDTANTAEALSSNP